MNADVSMKAKRIAVFAFAVVLVFLVSRQSPGASEPRQNADQQAKGRRIIASPDAQPEQFQIEDWQSAITLNDGTKTIRVDIAENGTRFTPDETPVFSDGLPAFGNEFVTEGYIYPAGTLNGPNGANPDGSPQFPNRVIGKWICRGFHVGDGAHTVTGPWVITHQLFDFGPQAGKVTIATDGFETPEVGAPINRAITGGTGIYSEIRGDSTQVFLGFNASNGVSLKVEIRPSKR